MFIKNTWINGKQYNFYEDKTTSDNKFTILIGENASGKSELIREVVGAVIRTNIVDCESDLSPYSDPLDEYLNDKYKYTISHKRKEINFSLNLIFEKPVLINYRSNNSYRVVKNYLGEELKISDGVFRYKFDVETTSSQIKSLREKMNVIAISNTPYDKFPILKSKSGRDINNIGYSCISLKNNEEQSYDIHDSRYKSDSKIVEFCYALLECLELNRELELFRVFDYLKLSTNIRMHYTLDNKKSMFNNINNDDEYLINLKGRAKKIYRKMIKSDVNDELKDIGLDSTRTFEFSINDNNYQESLSDMIILARSGMLNFLNVDFLGQDDLALTEFSSGQLSVLYSTVGLLSRIKDNSLIFIDEPEISLHPKWQETILILYKEIIDKYKLCHLIAATHSPQVASSLSDDGCYVLRMKDAALFQSQRYKNSSIDFHLADFFNAPGTHNDFIATELIKVLTLLTRTGEIDHEVKIRIDKLRSYEENIKKHDPLNKLYLMLSKMEDRINHASKSD